MGPLSQFHRLVFWGPSLSLSSTICPLGAPSLSSIVLSSGPPQSQPIICPLGPLSLSSIILSSGAPVSVPAPSPIQETPSVVHVMTPQTPALL